MDRSGLTRGTRWSQNYSPSVSSWEVIHEKTFSKKRNFDLWWPLVLTVLGWPPIGGNRSIARSWAINWLSYITILLASIVIEIIKTFSENIPILRTFDSFGPLWPHIWPDQKMSLYFFVELAASYRTPFTAFATFLNFVFSEGEAVIYPTPRPCEGGSDPRPCAGYNSACSHFWISEPTHRHERTDWRLGMEDWHEKAWTANQNQRDRLPRKDGAGASDCGRSAVHPPPSPPQTVSDIFPTLAFDRLSLLQRRRCQAARPPRTYSTGQLEACYL